MKKEILKTEIGNNILEQIVNHRLIDVCDIQGGKISLCIISDQFVYDVCDDLTHIGNFYGILFGLTDNHELFMYSRTYFKNNQHEFKNKIS